MKIINKKLERTADVSSARGTAGKEFLKMVLASVIILIAIYFMVGIAVEIIVSNISFKTEARIFNKLKPYYFSKNGDEQPANMEKAKAILERLKSHKMVPPMPYNLVLIEHKEPNAFAFPGGTIGMSTGLLDVLNDDLEIAFVIGHELGHFYNRDHLKGLGKAAGFGIISSLIFNVSSGSESFRDIMNFALQRNYSQDREKRADRFGIELVYTLYGKVEGTDRLFKILLDQNRLPGWAYMFSTHPSPEQRILDLKKYGQELIRTSTNA